MSALSSLILVGEGVFRYDRQVTQIVVYDVDLTPSLLRKAVKAVGLPSPRRVGERPSLEEQARG